MSRFADLTNRGKAWLNAEGAGLEPRLLSRHRRMRFIAVGIAIPTLLAFLYYALIARPEYETGMMFTIQGLEPQSPDLLSGIGIPAITGRGNDGLLVVEFIKSPEIVDRLVENYGFDASYGGWSADPFARVSPGSSLSDKTDFWRGQSSVTYEQASNIVEVQVRAYSPEESLRLAEGVLAETEDVVNSLNSRVQGEAVRVAAEEVAARREEYQEARRRVTEVRGSRATTIEAESTQQLNLIGQIESQLANARVERAGALAQFRPNSPQIRAMDEQIRSLEAQRAEAMAEIRQGPGEPEASRDVAAQTALIDYEFAQTAYYAAIRAHQQAVATRENERRYLVAFVPPRLASSSNYWGRFGNVLAIAVASALLMAVAALGYSVVKDHMQ